jgi:hypothetical protein
MDRELDDSRLNGSHQAMLTRVQRNSSRESSPRNPIRSQFGIVMRIDAARTSPRDGATRVRSIENDILTHEQLNDRYELSSDILQA